MSHFRDTHWIDLVRGVVAVEDAAIMRQHLDEGCAQCAETYGFWRKLGSLIEDDGANEPPVPTVRIPKSYVVRREQPPSRVSRGARTARVVFDTFAQPRAVGTGAMTADDRRLVYEAPPFTIELHLDSHTDPVALRIAGHILERRRTAAWPHGARVSITNADGELCATAINELGAFECRIVPRENVNLTIAPREGELIVIPLSAIPLASGVALRPGGAMVTRVVTPS